MTTAETLSYLDTLPTPHALWWFIENVSDDTEGRTEIFFALRARWRAYCDDPKPEHRYETLWRKLPEAE